MSQTWELGFQDRWKAAGGCSIAAMLPGRPSRCVPWGCACRARRQLLWRRTRTGRLRIKPAWTRNNGLRPSTRCCRRFRQARMWGCPDLLFPPSYFCRAVEASLITPLPVLPALKPPQLSGGWGSTREVKLCPECAALSSLSPSVLLACRQSMRQQVHSQRLQHTAELQHALGWQRMEHQLVLACLTRHPGMKWREIRQIVDRAQW